MQEMNELNAARAEHIAEKMTNQQFTVDSAFITDELLTKIDTLINTSHK